MNAIPKQQQGASTIAVILFLALLGAGIYIGFQYIPQLIESGTVDSILGNIEAAHKETAFSSVNAVQEAINKQLNINQIEELKNDFRVTDSGDSYIVKVQYERDLNLLYEMKTIQYDKSLTLNK